MTRDDWYEKNKDELLRSRRLRYEKDPQYREAQRRLARNAAKKRGMYLKEKRLRGERVEVSAAPPVVKVLRSKDGAPIRVSMFTVRHLAEKVQRSVGTVYKWEKAGIIPKSPFHGRLRRLYSQEMIDVVARIVIAKLVISGRGRVSKDDRGIYHDILDEWMKWGQRIGAAIDWSDQVQAALDKGDENVEKEK